MESIKNWWSKLGATQKRNISMLGLGVVMFGILWMYVSADTGPVKKKAPAQPVIHDPLTGTAVENLGVEALAGRLEMAVQDINTLKQREAQTKRAFESRIKQERENTMREIQRQSDRNAQLESKTLEQQQALEAASREILRLKEAQTDIQSGVEVPPSRSPQPRASTQDEGTSRKTVIDDEWDMFDKSAMDDFDSGEGVEGEGPDPVAALSINVIGEMADPEEEIKKAKPEEKFEPVYLASGSILTGTLITGMDAPTGNRSRGQPFPALLRIKHEAIMPNFFTTDITECFLLAAGYGDLSSERALLRAERISCVREDGGVIEANLDAFASGEDGKVGVRGRVVTRMGSVLAASAMAGFASGVAQAFSPQRVPIVSQSANSGYFTPEPSDVGASAVGQGVGNSLERLADYYMQMAEQTFPVIEIDAGRKINFVMVRGTSIQFKAKAN